MKKFLALYHQSLLLKLIVFFISSLLVVFIFSDFVIDAMVHNTVLWYKIQVFRWIIIPILLTFIAYIILRRPFKLLKQVNENFSSIQKNYRFVLDNLIDDYFFYRHEKGKPFVFLSSSVTNVLGYTKTDFINNFEKYGAGALYLKVFEKHQEFIRYHLKPISSEIIIKDAKNRPCFLEIKEIPILNEQQEIIAIEGTAKNITKYKTIELELNEKEKKYQTIFEAISDGLLVIKDNKYIDCNKRALEIFDCTIEEILMHTPFHYRFSPPVQPNEISSKEFALSKIKLANEGQAQHFEWVHLRNGKDPFPAEISLSKFTFDEEDYLLAIIRDISLKKNIIESLKEKEESYKTLYNNLPIGVLQLNTDGTIININPKGKEILHIQEEYEALFFVEQLQDIIDSFSNDVIHQVLEIKLLNLTILPLSVYVNSFQINDFQRIIILFEDISEKISLKKSCLKQESYFKEILENSRQILYKLNLETSNYEYISSALFDILGYNPEEFYQMTADEIKSLLHPDDSQKAESIVAKLIRNLDTLKNEFVIEYRFRHKNGEYKWLSDKYQIISQDDCTYIVGNIMDITQIKDAEKRIQDFLAKGTQIK